METRLTQFPCPKCGLYYTPQLTLKNKALLVCPYHGLYETSIQKSLSFRKYCSEIASKPNRSPFYYTTTEKKVKNILDSIGIVYFHNVGIELDKHRYYLDFYLPEYNIVLSVNPSIWHKLWNRDKSDNTKYSLLKKYKFNILILTDKELKMSSAKLKEYIMKKLCKEG